MIVDFGIVLLGFLIGLVSGSTGIGGGTLLAPFLMFALKVDPFASVGTDLFVSVITKGIGSIVHRREKNIETSTLVPMCVGGLGGALLGAVALVYLKQHLDLSDSRTALRHAIGIALCVSAVAITVTSIVRARHSSLDKPGFLGVLGGVVAAITTITGVGVGSLSVPALYLVKGRMALSQVVGTSLVFATVVTAVGTISHVALGDVNYRLSALLLCGSCPGVILGSSLSARAPGLLKPAVIALLMVCGARLIA